MGAALGWGSLAAGSLVLGALLAFARRWPPVQLGLVLAFGAGALISAVSFELTEAALAIGDPGAAATGCALGALSYFLLDGLIARRTDSGRGMPGAPPARTPVRRWPSAPSSTAYPSSSCSGSASQPARESARPSW